MSFEVRSPKLQRSKSREREINSRFHQSPVQTLSPVPRRPNLRTVWPPSPSSSPKFSDRTAKENRKPAIIAGAPTRSSLDPRKHGVEVKSRYLSMDNSPTTVRRTRSMSLSGNGASRTQWSSSPERYPAISPSKSASSEKLVKLRLDSFKGKKFDSVSETWHELRLLYNKSIQWRFANARADLVNVNVAKRVQSKLVCVWDGIGKLRHSVVQKKIELQKEKLKIKLKSVLQSHIGLLELWEDIERQHITVLTMTKESLHSVACKVPLSEGAKVETRSARIAIGQASDLVSSIKLMLTTFSPMAKKNIELMSKLANVVAQEKLLIQECLELLRPISLLEIEENSLRCGIIQMGLRHK